MKTKCHKWDGFFDPIKNFDPIKKDTGFLLNLSVKNKKWRKQKENEFYYILIKI